MIITTTPTIQGKDIVEYKGVIFGEVIAGINVVKDVVAGLSNIFGGRSGTYEEELVHARTKAMNELMLNAQNIGANAIVGVDVDYEVLGANNGMIMVIASGTAVIVK